MCWSGGWEKGRDERLKALQKDQIRIATGMACAAVCAAMLYVLPPLLLNPLAIADTLADRFAFVLPFTLLPVNMLMLGIAFIARHRFFDECSRDGSNPADDRVLQNSRNYLQNTAEQLLLALPVWAVLTVLLPFERLIVVPVLCVWFTLARLLFAVSYRGGGASRSFGFAATFYPTVLGLGLALYLWALS